MAPTLNGNDNERDGTLVDFGIADYHKSAIKNIKRFSIVSTYFPNDYDENQKLIPNPKIKIKRVVALPGDTFKIENSKLYIKDKDTGEFEYIPYTFSLEPAVEEGSTGKDIVEKELKENEYWVLGDHRNNSRDCQNLGVPILKDYILGTLVAIEGQAQLKVSGYVCDACGYASKSDAMCPNDHTVMTPQYELKNKQYHLPKYF